MRQWLNSSTAIHVWSDERNGSEKPKIVQDQKQPLRDTHPRDQMYARRGFILHLSSERPVYQLSEETGTRKCSEGFEDDGWDAGRKFGGEGWRCFRPLVVQRLNVYTCIRNDQINVRSCHVLCYCNYRSVVVADA